MKPSPAVHRLLAAASLCAALPLGVGLAQAINLPGGQDKSNTAGAKDRSHSHLSSALNSGPRQEAKLLSGIGNAHFPITTSNPEAQKFFDQGMNQFYSFMYYEAERSFRQAAKLDPEHPMPFWGIALNDSSKAKECLRLAKDRQLRASDRERRYIAALALLYAEGNRQDNQRKYQAALEQIVLDYPQDIEAKVLLGQELYEQADRSGGGRTAVDALLREVIEKNPLHPAANHFRIHLWDGPEARAALDSCARYPKAAPNIGHAQHMPGHIYAQLGMWEDAAYQMDAATRVERRYMREARQLPHDTWNYAHNQHYLIANLGYAGRLEEGERLARELIDVPRDPQGNADNDFSIVGQGRFAMLRMWLRGEQWERILADEKAGWPSLPRGKTWRHFARSLALVGKGDLAEAEKAVKAFEDDKPGGDAPKCALMEARGRLLMAQGKTEEGLEELKRAAELEREKFTYNDPGPYPAPAGEAYVAALIKANRHAEAEGAARNALEHDPNNGFALALLAESLHRQGKNADAAKAAEEFKEVFRYAEPSLKPVGTLRALGLLGSWEPRRFAAPRALDRLGPAVWEPFDMADFSLPDAEGKRVRLSDSNGKFRILVFILSGSCEHCIEQLKTFGTEKDQWDKLNASVLVVSPDGRETLKQTFSDKAKFPFPFLSDSERKASRLYKAWDEFENLELHATVLITPDNKVWWYRTGSTPFTDMEFLKKEIARVADLEAKRR
jgi:peroxiredoxin/tetratricopeptide (TPR) repeat protein